MSFRKYCIFLFPIFLFITKTAYAQIYTPLPTEAPPPPIYMTPTSSPFISPTITPTKYPQPTPTRTPTPYIPPSQYPSIGPTTTPTPTVARIAQCNQTCYSAGYTCAPGLQCIQITPSGASPSGILVGNDSCRNPSCPASTNCICVTPTITQIPTGILFNTPCPLPGDTKQSGVCDGVVNMSDYNYLVSKFGVIEKSADLKPDGYVNILDYVILSMNFK